MINKFGIEVEIKEKNKETRFETQVISKAQKTDLFHNSGYRTKVK